jgi:hypothetical protein
MGRSNGGARLAALVSSMWILAACGGATSVIVDDGGPTGSTDAGPDGDGQGADAASPIPCTTTPVTFHLRAPEGNAAGYCVGRGCDVVWLDIMTNTGKPVEYAPCSLTGCGPPICLHRQPVKAQGEQFTWDGNVWGPSVSSTCGSGQACEAPTCAAPGRYIAKMCATAGAITSPGVCNPSPTSAPTCVLVEFEYPTNAIVEGVLP